jgi:hypothetical protein
LLAPEEPQEEAPQEQEQAPEALNQAPAPSQEEPEPKEDPEIIEIEDDKEEEANGEEQPPSPPHDEAAGDVPSPSMGWTVKIYHKDGGNAVSQHRLVRMLSAYFADWHPAVEYVCWRTLTGRQGRVFFPRMRKKGIPAGQDIFSYGSSSYHGG